MNGKGDQSLGRCRMARRSESDEVETASTSSKANRGCGRFDMSVWIPAVLSMQTARTTKEALDGPPSATSAYTKYLGGRRLCMSW